MRRLSMLAAALLAASSTNAQSPLDSTEAAARLAGRWTVDLSTEPGKPYIKPLTLRLAADGSVSGSFYDSEIEAGRWKTAKGRTCVSFRTSDGVGPYHSSACVSGDRLDGQTWAEHRKFLFNWSAARAP